MHTYKDFHKFRAESAGQQTLLSCEECSTQWLLEPLDVARMAMTLERGKDWESDPDNQDYLRWYEAILAPRRVGRAPDPEVMRFDSGKSLGVSIRSVPG